MVSFTVVILNAALAVLSDKGQCVCVWGGGGGGRREGHELQSAAGHLWNICGSNYRQITYHLVLVFLVLVFLPPDLDS